MAQRFFVFDPSKCFGCHGCTAACKLGRGLGSAVTWRKVAKLPPHAGLKDLMFISNACCHCANPECLRRCPAKAYVKRSEDGIVMLIESRCMGCRYCTFVCPFGAPQFDPDKGVVTKCDFCVDRIDEGKKPLCIETCFGGALDMLVLEDDEEIPEGYSRTIEGFPESPDMLPSVLFKIS